ncbi:uncharacterized protein [Diadema setosum]|uniref:uncharacterized protein n=1 Tax=Diadema setosum TaxID=31175 RepID=UPI003B3B4E91
MTLRFDSFSTESNHDKVTISNSSDFSQVTDEFSGPSVPTSSDYDFSSAWIRFRSDSSINSDGFEAIISARCREDLESPNISCPTDITQSTDTGLCSANVTWSDPYVTDDSGVFTITSTSSSGSMFPVGNTTVSITAEDSSGNEATCNFTITVVGQIEVRNLEAVPLSASSVIVSWEPPAEGANLVTAYAILIWDVATGQLISYSVELPGEHSLLVSDLIGDTEYVIDVTPLGRKIVSRTASTTVVPPTGSTIAATTQSSHSQVNLESDGAVAAITSPNFPRDYRDNTNVSWSVTVPSGCQLHVHFVTFDTAFRDWLHIGDDHSYFGPVKPFDLDVNSERTLIRFVSNDRSTSTGFNITVQADCMQGAGTTEQLFVLDTDGSTMVPTTQSSHSQGK